MALKLYESLIWIIFNVEYIFVNALPHGAKFFGITHSILREYSECFNDRINYNEYWLRISISKLFPIFSIRNLHLLAIYILVSWTYCTVSQIKATDNFICRTTQ